MPGTAHSTTMLELVMEGEVVVVVVLVVGGRIMVRIGRGEDRQG